jgi:integrase/recombinase XerD
MKKLPLQNTSFRYIEQSFREWLDILGYSEITVYNLPNMIRELLHYMEAQRLNNIKDLTIPTIEAYYHGLKERSNQRKNGGALSSGHLNKHIQALRKFTEYLRTVGRVQIGNPRLDNEEATHKITWLTTEEIQDLFKASYKEQAASGKEIYNFIEKQEAFRSRDRAMLAIFYGCGLRRNEGVHIDISDINFDRSILHVRKGKNYKERLVPISKTSLNYLQEYIYDYRPVLQTGNNQALFLSHYGKRMQGQSLNLRLGYLIHKTENPEIMDKETGLHTLRHSIATHLLQAGMKLESISRFLGHSSLESTQIYTHLTAEAEGERGLSNTADQPHANIPTYSHYEHV